MRHTILFPIVVMAAFTGCGRQTTTTTTPPKAKTMSYTLDICGNKKIQNPTESDFRQAVFDLDTKKDEAFPILGPTEMFGWTTQVCLNYARVGTYMGRLSASVFGRPQDR